MNVFDGYQEAARLEVQLADRVAALKSVAQLVPTIGAVLFTEDAGSQLYTRIKKETAERIGLRYQVREFSLKDPVQEILATIEQLNVDPMITGIIIQKPSRKVWLANTASQTEPSPTDSLSTEKQQYDEWWRRLMGAVNPAKDVDGLQPANSAAVEQGVWRERGVLLPATCQAVLHALKTAQEVQQKQALAALGKMVIIGRSDLLGLPLFAVLKQQGVAVELIGSSELAHRIEQGKGLLDAAVVVSATGHPRLITGELIKPGSVVIDVGEPQPDVEFASVATKASFLTPVPGGIGPLTVVYLLQNAVVLAEHSYRSAV